MDEKYKEMSCGSRLLHSTVVKTREFLNCKWQNLHLEAGSDYFTRLCELYILHFPPLCVQILCLGTKDYLCNNPHASKKYAQLHMCLNVMLARFFQASLCDQLGRERKPTTAYPKIPKDNCTFVRHRQLCQRARWEALRIEWAERGNWICELNLLRFLFLFLTNSEGLCDADL